MDTKRLITSIAVVLVVFAAWAAFVHWYHPPLVADQTPPAAQPAENAPPSTGPSTGPSSAPSLTVAPHAVATAPSSEPVFLGSAVADDPNYVLQLAITPRGAGIEQVTLNHYKAADTDLRKKGEKKPYVFQTPFANHPGTQPLATQSIILHGPGGDRTIDLLNVAWERTDDRKNPGVATFGVTIEDASGPVARVTKTFTVQTRAATATTSLGYEVGVEQSVMNLSSQPLTARFVMNGTTPPPAEVEAGTDRAVVVGYPESGKKISVTQHLFSEFKPDSNDKDLTKDGDKHFVWAGQASTYFAAIVLPDNEGQRAQFAARAKALDPESDTDRNVTVTFETPDLSVAPQHDASVPLNVYFGPKSREILDTTYYSTWPRVYNELLAIRSSMCGFLTFQPVINALVALLGFFHMILRDWGLAIICLVLLVRAALHPITKRSQTQMMKMGKMGPEIERLKKKYADEPDVLNREMMKVYKEQGAGPLLGCLPMFLQMPIWIALWTALQGTFELRQAPFLYGFTWIHDLAKPDALIRFSHPFQIPITGWHVYSINILPVLMAVATYINQRWFTPMPPAATPEQESTQKMTRRMSVIFPLFFYSLPSGLNLYYLTSMTLGILEGKIIRDHIKQREEAEKAGRVFVPTKPTRGSKRKSDKEPENNKPKGFWGRIMTAMEQAQQKAEQIRKEQDKRKK
jgi:YidC/Oxa1 family membrane protein insertase